MRNFFELYSDDFPNYCANFDFFVHRSPSKDQEIKKPEPKKSENELHWEGIRNNMVRPLTLCDLDFTDLRPEDDMNDVMPGIGGGKIPPPPPMRGPPPPMMMKPMPPPTNLIPPPCFTDNVNGQKSGDVNCNGTHTILKNKKTVSSASVQSRVHVTSVKSSRLTRYLSTLNSRSSYFGRKYEKT